MQIVVGLLVVAIATTVVLKNEWIVQNFGYMGWAERALGVFGGTRLVIKLLGILAIFFGFLYMTNQLDGFLDFAFGWLIPETKSF